jgi:hypothetical protein
MKKAPISVKIIHVLSIISFYILIIATSVAFIGNILLQTGVIGNELQLRTTLPVTFEVNETGSVQLYHAINEVRIVDASGKMYLLDTPTGFSMIVFRLLFVVLMLVLFMTWKFKMFITNIRNGQVFEKSNINNLKHISYGILVLFVVTKIYEQVLYHTVVKYLEFDSITLNSGTSDRSDMLIAAMLLWVLAHVFMKGQELQQEHDLTV